MNMPKDAKGTAPEDVEAHMPPRRDIEDEEPGGRLPDTSEDVEAHRHAFDTDQNEDVDAHGAQRPRPADGEGDGEVSFRRV